MKKHLVLNPTIAGWHVAGCYGLALESMARDKAATLPGSRIIVAETAAGAGATLRRMPAGFEILADAVPNHSAAAAQGGTL